MATMEERFAALESEVALIKAQLRGQRYGVTGRTNPQQLAEILSRHTPDEADERVWGSIEEEREREREEVRRQIRDEAA